MASNSPTTTKDENSILVPDVENHRHSHIHVPGQPLPPGPITNITETPTESDVSNNDDPTTLYSIFTPREKRLLVLLTGLSMLFSPLTANIYFPAMAQLQHDLSASEQDINLTITVYLVMQAIAPALLGDLADIYGRRPAYIVMFAIYTASNIGLALQRKFETLLGLRVLQSLGCSASVAVSYGVFADVATTAERGGMVGVAMIATNLGPALAPLVGGGILRLAGGRWEWIFWFLVIFGGLMLLLVVMFLPETARKVVGNGRVRPRAWRRTGLEVLSAGWVKIPALGGSKDSSQQVVAQGGDMKVEEMGVGKRKRAIVVPNPLRSVRLLFHKDAFAVLLISGIFYMVYYCVQASIAGLFRSIYHLDDAVIGACYLSMGFGVVAGGYSNGRLLDWNYKATAREIGVEVDKKKGEDLNEFPIERARSRSVVWLNLAHLGALLAYAWVLERQVHISAPLIFQFLLGFLETCLVQTHNTLLVDIFQDSPSAAAASGNIVRCGLSAVGIAAMEPVMNIVGTGWYFTLLASAGALIGLGGTYVIKTHGMKWRLARANGGRPPSKSEALHTK